MKYRYRDYPADMVQLVLCIKTAQWLGFTLGALRQTLQQRLGQRCPLNP